MSITDSGAKDGYPISSFTYLLVYKKQEDSLKGKTLVDFLKWAIHDGQKSAPSLDYSPLPAAVQARLDKTIDEIRVPK